MATQFLGYPMKGGIMGDFHGKPIGTWRSVPTWRVNSWVGSHMHQIEGMSLTGRPKAGQITRCNQSTEA